MPHFSSLVFPFPQLRKYDSLNSPEKKENHSLAPLSVLDPWWAGWRLIGLGVPRGKVPGAYRAGPGGAFKGQFRVFPGPGGPG